MFADHCEHVGGREMLEARPAIVRRRARRPRMVVLPSGKNRRSMRLLQPDGFEFFERVQLVQTLDEQQVSDLLDDFERVGDPAGPEGIPDLVDLIANFAGEHGGRRYVDKAV